MMNEIDFRTMPMNIPSLCIPRVFKNIGEARIRRVFDDLKLGDIERIDIIPRRAENGDEFSRVFVHFRRWNDNSNANEARARLVNGKDIKVIYDDPWFWKISAYRAPEPRHQQDQRRQDTRPIAKIAFEDDEPRRPRQQETRPPRQQQDQRPARHQQDVRPPRQQQDQRPPRQQQDQRPPRRDDQRPVRREQDARPVRRIMKKEDTFEPRSPSSSPPRTHSPPRVRVTLDYGITSAPKKKLIIGKKPLIVEPDEDHVVQNLEEKLEKEEGEE